MNNLETTVESSRVRPWEYLIPIAWMAHYLYRTYYIKKRDFLTKHLELMWFALREEKKVVLTQTAMMYGFFFLEYIKNLSR